MAHPRPDGVPHQVRAGGGVAQGGDHPGAGEGLDEGQGPGELRGAGDDPHRAPGGVLHPPEVVRVGGHQLPPAPRPGPPAHPGVPVQPGPFHVEAQGHGPARGLPHQRGQAGEPLRHLRRGPADGHQEGGAAGLRPPAQDRPRRLRAVGEAQVPAPVGVDVDQAGEQHRLRPQVVEAGPGGRLLPAPQQAVHQPPLGQEAGHPRGRVGGEHRARQEDDRVLADLARGLTRLCGALLAHRGRHNTGYGWRRLRRQNASRRGVWGPERRSRGGERSGGFPGNESPSRGIWVRDTKEGRRRA